MARRRDCTDIALLTVRTGAELAVRKQVRSRYNLQCYVPQYLVNLRNRGMVAKVLFPGYAFVWLVDQWQALCEIIDVRGFVRAGENILRVQPIVVKTLQQREGSTGYVRLDDFEIGDRVRVKRQSMDDVAGTYLGMSDGYKARVLFKMLGRECEVQMFKQDLVAA